jgi:non-ribosomal peptide synthetase component F
LSELEYDTEIFDHATMESVSEAILRLLGDWSARPGSVIEQIDFSTEGPVRMNPLPEVCDRSLGSYFAQLATRFSDNLAVYDDNDGTSYTFSQLFALAQRMQERVRPWRVPGGTVMLLLTRSVDALAAEIGVSLAGMTWVPCDVRHPRQRILDIAADAGPLCVLAHEKGLLDMGLDVGELGVPVVLVGEHAPEDLVGAGDIMVDDAGEVA